MRFAVTSNHKNLILSEAKKNPYLGVRGLSKMLLEKYKINISKSAVNNILNDKGIKGQKGRKTHALLYQNKRAITDCSLLLLRAVDSEMGLFDFLKQELKPYFPHLEASLFKKLIMMFSFSSYIGGHIAKNAKREGFLRLSDCYFYPARNVKYFAKRIIDYKPAISLEAIKPATRMVSTLKFYFSNGDFGYCDAKLTTLWDGPCYMEDFFLPILPVKEKIFQMFKDKVFVLNYTKSFDYLSPLTVEFINGLASGIKRIDFLNEKGDVLENKECDSEKLTYLIGYYPRIISKGILFLEKEKRFKKLVIHNQEIFYVSLLTRFSQPKEKKAIILNNILIKTKQKTLPTWAILTDKKTNPRYLIDKYLLLWPALEKDFLEDSKAIENFFLKPKDKKEQAKYIPDTLSLEKEEDFAKITAILTALFKEQFGDADFKGNKGQFVIGKDFCKIIIRNISSQTKRKINNACLYINGKRLFVS